MDKETIFDERDFGVSYQIVENVLREHLAEPLVLDLLQEILLEIIARDLGIKREEAE